MKTEIGKGSLIETVLATAFVIIAVVVFIGAFLAFFAYVFGNIRNRWPYYEAAEKRKVIRSVVFWTICFAILGIMSTIKL
jgi:heme/copper-type cytochrome/quinol oxidase subunit 2